MSALTAVQGFLDRVEELEDPSIFLSIADSDQLFELADTLDRRPAASAPLRGMVFAVKDNIDVAGLPTTAACPSFAYHPEASAFAVERLVMAGAVPVAKTNLDQFATGLVGTRSPFGAPRNPHHGDYVPGGSSSGSAVAVARGLVDFALGTDTAGSGRVPAAFCGVVGVKPTRGLVSTTGSVPAVRRADCLSVFVRDIYDGSRILQLLARFDSQDPFARQGGLRPPRRPETVVLGIIDTKEMAALGVDPEIRRAYEQWVEAAKPRVRSVEAIDLEPFLTAGGLLYEGAYVAERTASLGKFLGSNACDVLPLTRTIIEGGWDRTAVDFVEADYERARLQRRVEHQFRTIDVLALPTVPRLATIADVQAAPLRVNTELGLFTTFANLVDLCALSVPASSSSDGVPIGVTLYGPAFEDLTLPQVASDQSREPAGSPIVGGLPDGMTRLVVAGAHLRGQPLQHQLDDLGARFEATTATASHYRLFALADSDPPKPGLVSDPTGQAIEVDVWQLTHDALGRFLQLVPSPLALGTVELDDGTCPTGFVCEPSALEGARDVTAFGGWRAFVEAEHRNAGLA